MTETHAVSPHDGRIEALKARHAALEEQISGELKSPAAPHNILKQLKIEKLKLKDEIEEEIRKAS